MARETKESTIEGVQFRVTQLGFKQARGVFMRVTKLLGPSLAALADGSPTLKAISSKAILGAISTGLEKIEDRDLDYLADVFGDVTQFSVDGQKWPFLKKENREELFSGQLVLFFRWLMFCLEVNFSDFLDVMPAPAGADQKPGTPTEST